MKERMVYLNGSLVPESQATISVFDRGVQYGDAVYDAARTFGGRSFKLREHIDRLYRSCSYTRMPLRMTADEMEKQTREVLEHNLPLSGPDGEAMIWWSVTRGVTSATRRTPAQCLDPRAKISNRMNHILADLEAKAADPEAYSLMLDINGNVAENSTGNFFFVRDGTVCTSGASMALEGVTRGTIFELARAAGIPVATGEFPLFDVYLAEEAFLTATSFSILPVASVNGKAMAAGAPGPVTQLLTRRWSELVGIDIAAQAVTHLT